MDAAAHEKVSTEPTDFGLGVAAAILARLPGATQERVFAKMTRQAPATAAKLSHRLYSLEALLEMDRGLVHQAVNRIPATTLAQALYGASRQVADAVVKGLDQERLEELVAARRRVPEPTPIEVRQSRAQISREVAVVATSPIVAPRGIWA